MGLVDHPAAEGDGEGAVLDVGDEGATDVDAVGTLPPGQGLEGGRDAVGDGDDGLVVELELALLHGLPQLGLAADATLHLDLQTGLEEAPRAPLLLRAVHGQIGLAHQALGVLGGAEGGDADAGADPYRMGLLVDPEGCADGLHELVGHVGGGVGVGQPLEDDGELVAPQAAQEVL